MRKKESKALVDRFSGESLSSLKWRIKTLIRNLQYLCNLSFYALTQGDRSETPRIKYSLKGALAPNYAKPVCLFCSYDNESIVRQGEYHYLKQLALAGFEVIFISSSDTISDVDLTKLPEYCTRIISRENAGYDFYSWKVGLEQYPQYHLHSGLLLANNSVLGPLFDISDIITSLENFDADIISMTDNFRFCPHLQSYFLYCKKPVILSEEFIRFFNWVKVAGFKTKIIRKYETGFSRLLGQRFRLGALYSLEHVLDQIQYLERPKNWIDPTIHLWKPLITQFKFPFLKKTLITTQGVSTQEISLVLAEVSSTFGHDMLTDWNAGPTQKA